MHGRDLARESMMNNDGGAMEERWRSGGSVLRKYRYIFKPR